MPGGFDDVRLNILVLGDLYDCFDTFFILGRGDKGVFRGFDDGVPGGFGNGVFGGLDNGVLGDNDNGVLEVGELMGA